MNYSKILICVTALVCLAFQAWAQDPLGAGSSGSTMGSSGDWISPNMGQGESGSTMGSSGDWISPNMGQVSSRANSDPGLTGMLQWLDTPVSNIPWYTTGGSRAIYPGPYGVYPYNPMPYYSNFRLNSLAGMNWEPFQKNWSETMDYAQTKSSFKVYPTTATYPGV